MKLFDALNSLWDNLVEWLEDIGEDILNFTKPLAKQIAKNGGKLLLDTALAAVVAAEQAGGSGSDKFDVAKNLVISELEVKGLPIVLNAVHGAIEAAVAKLNENG